MIAINIINMKLYLIVTFFLFYIVIFIAAYNLLHLMLIILIRKKILKISFISGFLINIGKCTIKKTKNNLSTQGLSIEGIT